VPLFRACTSARKKVTRSHDFNQPGSSKSIKKNAATTRSTRMRDAVAHFLFSGGFHECSLVRKKHEAGKTRGVVIAHFMNTPR